MGMVCDRVQFSAHRADKACMTEQPQEVKQGLRDVLNIRVDAALAAEVDRVAAVLGTSASDAARKLLQYGIEVARKLEADDLMRPYWDDPAMEHTDEFGRPMERHAEIAATWRWAVQERSA